MQESEPKSEPRISAEDWAVYKFIGIAILVVTALLLFVLF